jgi:YhfC intramembrane metalloprotease
VGNTNLYWSLVSAIGMILVAFAFVIAWRWITKLQYGWFWVGAGLWTVAVAMKVAIALLTNAALFDWMKWSLPFPVYVATGGLFGGLQSSLCEIGLTWLAVLIWRSLGTDADRAIGIGLGAGAFEALLLGLSTAIAVAAVLARVKDTAPLRDQIDGVAKITPLFWLVVPVERVIAVLCHASSRALVILGSIHGRPWMIFGGFVIFTAIDAIAVAAHLSERFGTFSIWWIELAILPFALVSIPIIRWCYARWGTDSQAEPPPVLAGPIT